MDFKDFPLADVGTSIQLVGGIWAGNGVTYLFQFPEYGHEYDTQVIHMSKDDWKALLRQSDLLETEVLSKCEDGKLYKAVVRKCQRNIDQQVSWNVFRRANYKCEYCGADSKPLTVDHAILWEHGGASVEGNLVCSCRKCNKTRGSILYDNWLNHEYYLRVSSSISNEQMEINQKRSHLIKSIELVFHKRKR